VTRRPPSSAGSRRRTQPPFIVVTGLSGSGKSQVIRALEDLGYFCVDNLPIMLIPTLAELSLRPGSEIARVAIVVDVRERTFLDQFPEVLQTLRRMRRLNLRLIFLEASDAALVRRFSETRRPHPLAHDRPVIEGIREERARLKAIRGMADAVVDTSALTVHELRRTFMAVSRGRAARGPLVVTLLSFGFKHGIPVQSDLVFDVRCLPNPHFVHELRVRTGRHHAVAAFMLQHEATRQMLARLKGFLRFVIPQYVAEGKSYLTVSIGCTGGRHRSVMIAEALRTALGRMAGVRIRVSHRDISAGGLTPQAGAESP
jgi:UPF0042 nucleotide-binding protein